MISRKLVASARRAGSHLLSDVFTEATTLVNFYADWHWKSYGDSKELCARFICDARMYPELNCELSDDITYNTAYALHRTYTPHII